MPVTNREEVHFDEHAYKTNPLGYLLGEGFSLDRIDYMNHHDEIAVADIAAAYYAADDGTKWEMLQENCTQEALQARYDERYERALDDHLSSFGFYTVDGLTEAERQPPEFIVDGLVPVGLTFLCGAPKTRKSYMALQLSYAVATGTDFLRFSTTKSSVIYFDLEGSKSRISSRVEQMQIRLPNNVMIANQIPNKLSNGLVEDIKLLHERFPDVRLFIIDTYSRARGSVKTGGANAYDTDVSTLEPLQRMAIEEKIAVLCIHHEKKNASVLADPFERMSGTMGISGSCDSVINLMTEGKRCDGKAKFEYTPRDAMPGEMILQFDSGSSLWREDVTASADIAGNPIVAFCIENAPNRGNEGQFFRYKDLYTNAYHVPCDSKAGDTIQPLLLKYQDQLYTEYGIGVQLGVKSHGDRGVRVYRK